MALVLSGCDKTEEHPSSNLGSQTQLEDVPVSDDVYTPVTEAEGPVSESVSEEVPSRSEEAPVRSEEEVQPEQRVREPLRPVSLAGSEEPDEEKSPGFDEFGGMEEPAPSRSSSRGRCGTADLIRALPARRTGANSGNTVFESIRSVDGVDRDRMLAAEIRRGNFPESLKNLRPVVLRQGLPRPVTICVMPDYLSVGSDSDSVRFPMGLTATASLLADLEFLLPTVPMVNQIYAQADVKLSPSPQSPGPQMGSSDYILRHDRTIDEDLGQRTGLIAGHKKDLVVANRLLRNPGRIAIYGWHRSEGDPIQPLSTVHGAEYADYSHGIRLVAKYAFIDDEPYLLTDLLADEAYAAGLNSDGVLRLPTP